MHVNFKKIAAGVIAVLAYVASPPVLGLIHDAKVTGIITAPPAIRNPQTCFPTDH